MHYEIRNAKTDETIVLVSRSKSSDPEYQINKHFALMEKAGGKGKYKVVEVK